MINILACSIGNPNCVLDIVGCLRHAANVKKKDAFDVSTKMLHHTRGLDLTQRLFDMIAFDGAYNVQKA